MVKFHLQMQNTIPKKQEFSSKQVSRPHGWMKRTAQQSTKDTETLLVLVKGGNFRIHYAGLCHLSMGSKAFLLCYSFFHSFGLLPKLLKALGKIH